MTSTAPRGFTLIELLIGSSILLIVVTGVYTSFSLGLQVRERCRSGADPHGWIGERPPTDCGVACPMIGRPMSWDWRGERPRE